MFFLLRGNGVFRPLAIHNADIYMNTFVKQALYKATLGPFYAFLDISYNLEQPITFKAPINSIKLIADYYMDVYL